MSRATRVACVHYCSRKQQHRSLLWRIRARIRRAIRKASRQRVVKFQYDPLSYALNFDDGCSDFRIANAILSKIQSLDHGLLQTQNVNMFQGKAST